MDQSLEPRRKRTAQRDRRQKRKRKEKGKGSKSEKGFSLSCCRKGQKVKRVEKRESKGKKKKGKMASKSRSRKSRSKSKKKRKSKKSKKRKRSKKSKSRKARGRKSRRRKSRSRRSRSKSRSKRVKSIGKEDVIRDNRAHLVRSQSLTGPSKDTSQSVQRDPTLQGSPLVTLDAPITPFSPMKKDKRTKHSEDGAILKAAPPVLESNFQFQPLRSPDDREYPKKEGEPPSTAIDIDSSIRKRRPRRAERLAMREPTVRPAEEIPRKEEDIYSKPKTDEPVTEPAIQRVSDLVPLEEGIDPEYPAQRIVISNFVRNGCHVKRWLYEDSYPVDGPRPTFRGLMETGRQRKQYARCCCGRRAVCDGFCGRDLTAKQRPSIDEKIENDRIRGELQRLDVILRNLDD